MCDKILYIYIYMLYMLVFYILIGIYLFTGLAGVIYFLLDVQQPYLAKFPTYDITIEQ